MWRTGRASDNASREMDAKEVLRGLEEVLGLTMKLVMLGGQVVEVDTHRQVVIILVEHHRL